VCNYFFNLNNCLFFIAIYISFLSQFVDVNCQVFDFNTITTTSGPSFTIVPSSFIHLHLVNNMERSQTLTLLNLPIAKTEVPLPLAEGNRKLISVYCFLLCMIEKIELNFYSVYCFILLN